MSHTIVGWLGFFGLAIFVAVGTTRMAHYVNKIADRDGIKFRTVGIVRSSVLLAVANVAFAAAIYYWLPAFLLHTMLWTLAAQAVGIPLGLLHAKAKLIRFYRRSDKWGEWSNFADYPLVEGDIVWPTSEHRFQAGKFTGTDEDHRKTIRFTKDPMEAATLGRDRSKTLRSDWHQPAAVNYTGDNANLAVDWQRFCSGTMRVKDYCMLEAVRLKVRQHKELRDSLLATGDAIFIEHTEVDSYWADGGDGTGVNMLGKIIMIVREEERRRG
jgi:N-glycosidase YbiA